MYAGLARLATILAVVTLTLNGCAGLFGGDPLRVNVAGIEPVDGQGLEMRFNVKLRVQNPNDSTVSFTGVSLDLELNGEPFASGVSDQSGHRAALRRNRRHRAADRAGFRRGSPGLRLRGAAQSGQIPYILRGKARAATNDASSIRVFPPASVWRCPDLARFAPPVAVLVMHADERFPSHQGTLSLPWIQCLHVTNRAPNHTTPDFPFRANQAPPFRRLITPLRTSPPRPARRRCTSSRRPASRRAACLRSTHGR